MPVHSRPNRTFHRQLDFPFPAHVLRVPSDTMSNTLLMERRGESAGGSFSFVNKQSSLCFKWTTFLTWPPKRCPRPRPTIPHQLASFARALGGFTARYGSVVVFLLFRPVCSTEFSHATQPDCFCALSVPISLHTSLCMPICLSYLLITSSSPPPLPPLSSRCRVALYSVSRGRTLRTCTAAPAVCLLSDTFPPLRTDGSVPLSFHLTSLHPPSPHAAAATVPFSKTGHLPPQSLPSRLLLFLATCVNL